MKDVKDKIIATLSPLLLRVRTDVSWVKYPDGRQARTNEALTPQLLAKHVNGGPARGVVPMHPGQSVTFMALLDFDSHKGETPWADMQTAALGVMESLRAAGAEPYAYRSSGGRGIHVYLVWEQPQDAYSVRQWLRQLLGRQGFKDGPAGVGRGEVEIFPKQDEIAPGKFGNQFILPLAGQSVPLDEFELGDLPKDWPVPWRVSASVPVASRPEPVVRSPIETPDTALLREALAAIPNEAEDSLPYDAWRNVVFAIHSATDGSDEGLAIAEEFSARSSKADLDFLRERVWPYIRERADGVTVGTIYRMAREASGWTEPINPGEFDTIKADVTLSAAEAAKPSKYVFQQVAAFAAGRPLSWFVKGFLPRADLGVLFGETGSGKSFLVTDLAAAIAMGEDWRGMRTKQARVAYIVAEGTVGFRGRLRALAARRGLRLEDIPILALAAAPNFLDKKDVEEVAKALQAAGGAALIIVDTWSQVTAGGNENSGEDMGRALAHCRALQKVTGAMVLLIHHSGKDGGRGARGWSGLKGAADVELEVVRAEDRRSVTVTKMKDGTGEGKEYAFRLATVPLGEDEDGDEITSCVVEHSEDGVSIRAAAKAKLGHLQQLVLGTLTDMAGVGCAPVEILALREAVKPEIAVGKGRDTRNQRIDDAVEGLVKHNLVAREGVCLRLCVQKTAE